MNETLVTLSGWLGGDVTLRRAGDSPVAHFRVACTPRRYNPRSGEWFDAETQWYSVNAWRGLADNCAGSLRRGDPVIVYGRQSVRTYVNAHGVEVTAFEIEATMIGHDLSRGTSQFARSQRAASPGPDAGEEVATTAA